jgi:hypothetical protein
MKSFFITFNLFSLFLLFSSCGSESTSTENQTATDTTAIESDHHDHSEAINLNEGEKWKVDSHMLGFIRSIETDVTNFGSSAGEKNLPEYIALSDQIATNLDSLTSNCTMTGQAHDELHKWLLPFLDLNDSFSASQTIAEADSVYSEITKSFTEFNTYFE